MPSRPVYRVAAAGLDPRDVRLIEIVFKHSQYNRFEFVFEPVLVSDRLDILIVDPASPDGVRALDWLGALDRRVPVVHAVARGATGSARHALSIDRLTLQLLPILNRVVEMELLAPTAQAPELRAGLRAAPPVVPGQGGPAGSPQTRDFLREAARLSREGDSAREAAMLAAAPAAAAPAAPAGPDDSATAAAAARGAAPAPAVQGPQAAPAQGPQAAPPAPTPQAAPDAAAASRPASNLLAFPLNGEASAPRLRVLVVDDSPTVRKQLSLAFARMRIECDAVASAAQALERLDEHHYDLALVDVVMPEMDGYKLTRQIRRRHRGLPVIILTSRSSPFDLARGALAGCSSYLVKPVPLRQLEAAVVKHLRRSLAIDDLGGLIRLSPDPQQARGASQGAAAPARDDAAAGRTSRSAGQ
ncbi:MAG: response regulator [Burkholderiales bacterium]|nr:response regulator [Burkholderiales bacterium]